MVSAWCPPAQSAAWLSPPGKPSLPLRPPRCNKRFYLVRSLSVPKDSSSGPAQQPVAELQQLRTPILDAVRQRGDAVDETPFHVPGHKRGTRAPEGLARLVRPSRGSVLQYDLTEIAGLDFLSSPSGPILEAQQLAAEAFGAETTWFLVNGCSAGIHAAVVAVTGGAVAAAAAAAVETEGRDRGRKVEGPGAAGEETADARTDVGMLIVARNCHLSAFSAMVIAGCEPHWLQPEVDPRVGVAHCVTRGSVRAALEDARARSRTIVGVLIVSPTYFGAVADVEGIAAECHQYDVPLLVDEAHGGHFAFLPRTETDGALGDRKPHSSEPDGRYGWRADGGGRPAAVEAPGALLRAAAAARLDTAGEQPGGAEEGDGGGGGGGGGGSTALSHTQPGGGEGGVAWPLMRPVLPAPLPPPPPPSALSCGADLVMQSTHKVLGALTQAAMLHARGPRVCRTRISRALQTLQSSSPSYLLMASLDAARAQAAAGGAFEEPSEAAQIIRVAVSRCRRIELLDERTAGSRASVRFFDPLRLTLLVERMGLPGGGFGAAEWLERQHGVVPELATAKTVVLALGPGTTRRHAEVAAAAILDLDRHAGELSAPADTEAGAAQGTVVQTTESVDVVLTPRAAYFAPVVSIPAAETVGRVSAELLCPYPPGVPVLFPGERITAAALAALRATLAAGGAVTGAKDGSLETLVVVAGR